MGATHFSGPVISGNGVSGGAFTVATAPPASNYPPGTVIFTSDGGGGNPMLVFSDGSNWIRFDTGGVFSAVGGPAPDPNPRIITQVPDSQTFIKTLNGRWPVGTLITTTVTVIDPNGTPDTGVYETLIPPGAPPGGWLPETAAQVYAESLNSRPHIGATYNGNEVTIVITDSDYSFGSVDETIQQTG